MRPCLNLLKPPIRAGSVLFLVACLLAVAIGTFLITRTSVSRVNAASTGLVAAYAFNEGSGTIVTDSSGNGNNGSISRSEEHTSELQSHVNLVCRLLLEKKNIQILY